MDIISTSSQNAIQKDSFNNSERSCSRSAKKEGYLQSSSSTVLPITNFHCSEILRKKSLNSRSQQTKQAHQSSSFQNDKSRNSCKITSTASLADFNRFARCLSTHTNKTKFTEIPVVYNRPPTLLLQGSAIRAECCATSIYTNPQMAATIITSKWSTCGGISGRLGHMGYFSSPDKKPYPTSLRYSIPTRVPNKYREISARTNSTVSLAGNRMVFRYRSLGPAKGQARGDYASGTDVLGKTGYNKKTVGTVSRENIVCLSNIQTPPPVFLSSCEDAKNCISKEQRCYATYSKNIPSRVDSLDYIGSILPTTKFPSTATDYLHVDRCIFKWLGSCTRNKPHKSRTMGFEGSGVTHQREGNFGCGEGDNIVQSEGHLYTSVHRQRAFKDGHFKGRISISNTSIQYKDTNETHHIAKHPDTSFPNPFKSQYNGRCTEQESTSCDRMATTQRGIQKDNKMARPTSSRLDGNTDEFTITSICEPILSSEGRGDRCPKHQLEQVATNLHIPTEELSAKNSFQTSNIQISRSFDSTLAPSITVVPISSESQCQTLAHSRASNSRGTRCVAESRLKKLRQMDRIQFLKKIWTLKYGTEVASSLCTSYRSSSIKQAQCAWNSFKKWLPIRIKRLRKSHVLRYLIYLQDSKGLSAKTVLGYRNSLQLPLLLGFKIDLSDKEFSLLSRSQFLKKPPVKKLIPQWSLERVFDIFSSQEFNCFNISITNLFLKTLFLVALASGNRISELANLSRIGILYSQESVTIPVRQTFLFKNEKIGRSPPPIHFPALDSDDQLCPVTHLKTYLERTRNLPHNGRIFVHPISGKPLASGRLNYWLTKSVLQTDTSMKVRAHDVRKMSHSIAWTRGVPMSEIIRNGFWSSPNIFINKYLVPTNSLTRSCVAGREKISII